MPVAGPPMASTPPTCSPMFRHISIEITLRVESCISSSARSMTRDFPAAGNCVGLQHVRDDVVRHVQVVEDDRGPGMRRGELRATAAVIGITRGMFRGASSSMDQKRATVA
jgi:hypothetical protein